MQETYFVIGSPPLVQRTSTLLHRHVDLFLLCYLALRQTDLENSILEGCCDSVGLHLGGQVDGAQGGLAGEDLLSHAAVGDIPGWAVAAIVTVFYTFLGVLTVRHRESPGELAYGDAHM
jgi:hypothetical protein